MKIEIDLKDIWTGDDFGTSVDGLIREEINDAIRRKVKSILRDKENALTKAVQAYARKQARVLENKLTGADALGEQA